MINFTDLLKSIYTVGLREAAHAGAGALVVFASHYFVNPILPAITIFGAVIVHEVMDVTHGHDPIWKAILDVLAWAGGLYLGIRATL